MRWHIRVGEVEESVTHVGRKVDLGMLTAIQAMAGQHAHLSWA